MNLSLPKNSLYYFVYETLWIATTEHSLEFTYLSSGGWLFLLSIEEGFQSSLGPVTGRSTQSSQSDGFPCSHQGRDEGRQR